MKRACLFGASIQELPPEMRRQLLAPRRFYCEPDIREVRIRRERMTLRRFSEATGIPPARLNKIERGTIFGTKRERCLIMNVIGADLKWFKLVPVPA